MAGVVRCVAAARFTASVPVAVGTTWLGLAIVENHKNHGDEDDGDRPTAPFLPYLAASQPDAPAKPRCRGTKTRGRNHTSS